MCGDGGHKVLLSIIILLCITLIVSSIRIERLNKTLIEGVHAIPDSVSIGRDSCVEGLR